MVSPPESRVLLKGNFGTNSLRRKHRTGSWLSCSARRKRQYLYIALILATLFLTNWIINSWRSRIPVFNPKWSSSFQFGASKPEEHVYTFGIVADLDKKSKVKSSDKPLWRSIFKIGQLELLSNDSASVSWPNLIEHEIFSPIGEAGRGMELSELAVFDDRLLTFDDRTGVVYEISKDFQLVPRHILMEGDGNTAKGQKTEWATRKGARLYVGSFGKEYTGPGGKVLNRNNMWVTVIDGEGRVWHEDWTEKYEKLRSAVSASFPGYLIIEAIEWSDVHARWFVLPRRVSSEAYDEVADERRGSNLVMSADENFDDIHVLKVGTLRPTHGFSSFKFLPKSGDSLIAALKTEENEASGTQTTHLMVFQWPSGTVLLDETEIPGGVKFEGLAFL
eukprot:209049_1